MSAILLDTHVWVWYISGHQQLSKLARKSITRALHQNEACLADISLWEISMLDKKKRIILEMPCLEWINKFLTLTPIRLISITPKIAAESCCLPGDFHGDPADCLIVATARVEGLTLATHDARIISYGKSKYISTIKV